MTDDVLEVLTWSPEDHPELPGLAHGLTRYGPHSFDVFLSVVPEGDAMAALDSLFATLRDIVAKTDPQVRYFTVDLRVEAKTPISHPR